MGKVLSGIFGLILLMMAVSMCKTAMNPGPGAGTDDPELFSEAVAELEKRGLQYESGRLVVGVDENAVCGVASGQRFIHRPNTFHKPDGGLLMQNPRYPKPIFDLLHKDWCGA